MIKIHVQNGIPCVWSAEDWLKLRQDHRIVGNLIGCLANFPRQDNFLGLPLQLLPEEMTLLIEKGVATPVTYACLLEAPSEKIKECYKKYSETNKTEQLQHYEEERKKQVVSMIDKILEGKRRKMLGLNTKKRKDQENKPGEASQSEDVAVDRDAILKSELSKTVTLPPTALLVQTFTAEQWMEENNSEPVDWKFPVSQQEILRYKTFKDLWEKGYYITSGHKFGGDYLVYPGDPVKFHAQFIVLCCDSSSKINGSDLVPCGRMGCSTRKTFVIASKASDKDDTINYLSFEWFNK